MSKESLVGKVSMWLAIRVVGAMVLAGPRWPETTHHSLNYRRARSSFHDWGR